MHRQYERIIALTGTLLMLLVLATPAIAAPKPPPPPPAPQVPFFGMNTYFSGYERAKNDGEDGIDKLLKLGRDAGVGWAREEISWANLEPAKGVWNWNWLDRRILQMSKAGYGITGM